MTTGSPDPNTPEAVKFLQRYAGDDLIMLTAIVPDQGGVESISLDPTADERKLREWIDKRQGKANIYFSVNPTMRPLSGVGVKAKKVHIRGMRALHVDLDPRVGEDLKAELERGLRLLREYKPAPSFIVCSGGGVQGFWLLAEEQPTGGSEERAAEMEAYNQQIALTLKADPCHNIDRIMRVPGTINVPDAKKVRRGRVPALASLAEGASWHRYELSEFTPAPRVQSRSTGAGTGVVVKIEGNLEPVDLDKLGEKVKGKVKEVIVQGEDKDDLTRWASRSECLFWVTCELVRAGLEDETIAAILLDRDLGISSSVLDKPRPNEYAARQIQRAREEVVSPELRELNEKHAVIADMGGKCRVISEVYDHALKRPRISRQSFDDFRNRYMHLKVTEGNKEQQLGKWWLLHPMRRQFDSIVFAPGQTVEGAFNLWKGFACEAIPGNCGKYLSHLRENVCSGNTEHYNYLVQWMARAVQKPDSPGEVAIILRGRQGTGKGFFVKALGSLFGRHFLQVGDPKHLVGSFNAHLRDCVLLFGDEAFYAGDKKHESILKTLVTEETLMIEAKGVDVEVSPNYTHLILASNSQWVVPAGGEERRFFVLDVADTQMQNSSYFADIQRELDNGGREALLHYLMTMDLSEFNVRKFPKTDALLDQKVLSLRDEESWWVEKLRDGELLHMSGEWRTRVLKEAVHADYIEFCARQRVFRPMTPTSLGRFLHRVLPPGFPKAFQGYSQAITYHDDGDGSKVNKRAYFYEIPDVETCRAHFDKTYGQLVDWEDISEPVDEPELSG